MHCSLGDLLPDAERFLDLPLTATAAGEYPLTARVGSALTADLRNDNDQANTLLVVQVPADLGVSLTPLPVTIATGSQFMHTVQVTNAGPGTAMANQLTYRVSGGGGVASAPAGCTARAAGEWTCALGDLPAAASVARDWGLFTFAPGPLDVTATVTSATMDPSAANDTAAGSGSVRDLPDLSLRLEAAATPPGVAGTGVRAVVFNGGTAPASDIRVQVPLPPGLWLTGSNGQCAQEGTRLICRLGALSAESGPATVVFGLLAAPPGSHTLTGSVGAPEGDANTTNDTDSITLSIAAGSPPQRRIPVLPAWAMAVLAALLLTRGRSAGR